MTHRPRPYGALRAGRSALAYPGGSTSSTSARVPCPRCGVPAGVACTTDPRVYAPAKRSHVERAAAAKDAP